ncbi:hypothetical protein [Nocardioides rubriscoriae]|uniref:hypothetical protein n=1 Tax=Nocardioides rubriscoriae TaxID=642762 RepID=UPI0011DF460B|nr:hypothetical protein [Nocardioides rubriscoriae]
MPARPLAASVALTLAATLCPAAAPATGVVDSRAAAAPPLVRGFTGYGAGDVYDMVSGPAGTAYVIGYSYNDGSLEIDGAGAGYDATILRLSASGAVLDSRFLGGAEGDVPVAATLLGSGDLVVVGETSSADFPVTPGNAGTAPAGQGDAFVTVLSADLATVKDSVVLGGTGRDKADAVAVDRDGSLWVAGSTTSAAFPVTSGYSAAQGEEVWTARFSADLATRPVSVLSGGSNVDRVSALAAAPGGGAVVVGYTGSSDFTTVGATLPGGTVLRGGRDGFVSRFAPDGTLSWSELVGGDDLDDLFGVAAVGNRFVLVGATFSSDFPGGTGLPRASTTQRQGLVVSLSGDGSTLSGAATLGGTDGPSDLQTVRADSFGDLYVVGSSAATDAPRVAALPGRPTAAGPTHLYAAKLDGAARHLRWSTYVLPDRDVSGYRLALLPGSRVLLGGSTTATDLPVTDGSTPPITGVSGALSVLDPTPHVLGLAGPRRTQDRTPTWRFRVDLVGSRTQCRVDARAWGRCGRSLTATRFTSTKLRPGRHTLRVRAQDGPGNLGPAVSRTIRILRRR